MAASVHLHAKSAGGVVAEVTRIVREATGIGDSRELAPEESLAALGLDSLAIVNVVAAVEARYGRELADALWGDRRGISIAVLAEAVAQADGDAAVPRGAPAAGATEQPGVARSERLFLQLERHGPGGRAAAGALHRSVIAAHWVRAQQRCVILTRDLDGELPELPPPSGVT